MPDFDDELDRRIGDRFSALHGSLTAAVPLPGAEEIIARGRRRRRNAHAALGGLAVFAVLAVGFALVGPLRPDGAPQPAAEVTASPSPAGYLPPPHAARAPLGNTVPEGFLPIEGKASRARLEPLCPGAASLPSNGSIVASSAGNGATLLVYPASMMASRAFEEYRAEVNRCAESNSQTSRQVEALSFGAQAFQVVTTTGSETQYEAVVRYGRGLLLVQGPTPSAITHAGDLERTMCVFAADCEPRGGRPSPAPTLTGGGRVWAAVLAIDADPSSRALGRAVAAASAHGYRTSVASVDCDEGAREAFGLAAGTEHRYVPVYFTTRKEAEAFSEKASMTPVAVIEVRTFCLG